MWRQLTKTISACPAPAPFELMCMPSPLVACTTVPLFRPAFPRFSAPLGTTALGPLVWDSASGKHFNFCATWGIPSHPPLLAGVASFILLFPAFFFLLVLSFAVRRCLCCSSPSACFPFSSFCYALVVVSGIKKMAVLTAHTSTHRH